MFRCPGFQLREYVLEPVAEEDGRFHRAAGLLRKIITAHVFEDTNKRIAWTVTVLYLEDHDAEPADRDTERVERILKRVRRYDIEEISGWLAIREIYEDRQPEAQSRRAIRQRLYRWMGNELIMSLKEREDDVGSLSERVERVIQEDRELFDALDE